MKKFLFFKGFKESVKKDKVDDILDIFLELKELADKLCDRIDNKIAELKEIERRVDSKIEQYKNLISRVEVSKVSKTSYDKRNEVIKLYLSGEEPLSISKKLGLPIGEVEFLINLYKIKTSEK